MIKKLRFWLADRLLNWAMRLHFDMVLEFVMTSHEMIMDRVSELEAEREAAKRQATLDTKPKRGRPLGSKTRNVRPGVKLGRPKGSKDRVGGQRAQG